MATEPARAADRLAELQVICAKLNAMARTLGPELLSNGHWEGNLWRCGDLANNPGQSLCVFPDGRWIDFSACEGMADYSGDMLDLVALVNFGGRKKDAIAWARMILGLDSGDPDSIARERAKIHAKAESETKQRERDAERRKGQAIALFLDKRAVPIEGTPAEEYLLARGVDLAAIGGGSRALAYHPAVYNHETKQELPALIARVLDAGGQHVATHRTWLAFERGLRWWKAPLETAKMALGSFGGGYIPLWKGTCARTLAKIDQGTDVYVSEGIEDGLSVACARPACRVIAAIALSNIGNIVLPPQAGRMVILAQRDGDAERLQQMLERGEPMTKSAGFLSAEVALQTSIARQQERGRTVAIALPPAGVKDWNELAQRDAREQRLGVA